MGGQAEEEEKFQETIHIRSEEWREREKKQEKLLAVTAALKTCQSKTFDLNIFLLLFLPLRPTKRVQLM